MRRLPCYALAPLAFLFISSALPGASLAGQSVTPTNGSVTVDANTSGNQVVFTVTTGGSAMFGWTVSCTYSGQVTSCSAGLFNWKQTSPQQVAVTFAVGGSGTGGVGLDLYDGQFLVASGNYNVTVTTPPPPPQMAPIVALKNQNGSNFDRSRCLTVAAGEAAAIQCGDLLVAHGLPPYRTMGRDRSLTLLYNSATAVPRPLVAAEVTQDPQGATPTSVKAEFWTYITSTWVKRAEATYGGWAAGTTRQVALAFDATSLATAIDSFELRVTNNFSGGGALTSVVGGVLMVVNRASSEFGSGWHPVGVERLILGQPGSRILWVGGDGSAVVYASAGANKWAASPAEFRDTVEWTGSQYVRRLKDRVQVTYDATGRHTQTIAATGATTTFYWNGGTGRLDSIRVPPAGVSATTYRLVYDGNGKIDKLIEPTSRQIELTVTSGRLTIAADFDVTPVTSFGYDGSGRLTSRTNRGGRATAYTYGNGVHVTQFKIPIATADTAATVLEHWDEKGLGVGSPGGTLTAAATTTTYTKLFGPRVGVADDVTYWLDKWGAPTSVTDPRGYVTTFTRGDAAKPALVTRVQYPDGRKLGLVYNARGNVTQIADSTHDGTGTTQLAVTTVQYNDAGNLDGPSSLITPGGTTQIGYHATFGLPVTITAPGGHQTGFQYFASGSLAGLLDRVTEYDLAVVDTTTWTESAATNDLVTQFYYDAWGNDTAVVSPMGHRNRKVYDSYRRVLYAFDPVGHRADFSYTTLNQISSVKQYDDTLFTNPKTTEYYYGTTGVVDSVLDPRDVKRSWTYDWAGRPTVMRDEQSQLEYRSFDQAGLLQSVTTRLGHVVQHTYDPAGNLTKTKYPSTYDARRNITVAADSIVRTYDAMGRLLTAWNAQGTVTRTYHREGTVKTETQQINGGGPTFNLRYWYDAANRRTRFFNGIDTLTYTYGADGLLAQLSVQWVNAGGLSADVFRFKWDGLGQRDSVIYTNGTRVGFGYDRDSRLRLVCSIHAGGGTDDYLDHRLRYEVLDKDGMPLSLKREFRAGSCGPAGFLAESQVNTYDGRHQLLTQNALGILTTFQYDGSGNMTSKQVGGSAATLFTHPSFSNRVSEERVSGQLMVGFKHNLNGDRVFDSVATGGFDGIRHFFYNAVGQMAGSAAWIWTGTGWTMPESASSCRYDALGRRIAGCEIMGVNPWLGFDGENVARANAETWRYVHGPGLDDPLVGVYKYAYNEWRRYYYLTDGRGRFLAFTNWDGYDYTTELDYTQNGGALAGAIEASHTFENGRAEAPSIPKLSFYRNRYYDQRTGKWTQEDPIGLAGGINLYGYAGNNPVAFTDPFGLCKKNLLQAITCAAVEGAWTLIGAAAGFGIGGGTGAIVALATGGVGSPAIPAGAWQGAALGSAAGLAVGQAITGAIFDDATDNANQMAKAGKGRGGNQGPNAEVDRIVKEFGLNRAGQRALHDQISKQNLTTEQIREIAEELAKQAKYLKNPPPPQP